MLLDRQFNPFIFIGIAMCFILFNLFFYRNYVFVFFCTLVILVYLYDTMFKTKTMYSKKNKLELLLKQIRLEELSSDKHVALRVPRRFRYLLVTDELSSPIVKLKFLNRYYEESFVRIVVLLEKFLKRYYRIITKRSDLIQIENMKDLYEEILSTEEEIYLNVPEYERHSKKKNLHRTVHEEFRHIQKNLKQKLRLVLSLRN
jgi:hypothetical protein